MDPISSVLLNKALDGLSMRMVAISENIANVQSRDYRPLKVTFEDALRQAKASGMDAIARVEPQIIATPTTERNGELRVDMELANAAATGARYAALIDVLNRQMQLSRVVVSGGQ